MKYETFVFTKKYDTINRRRRAGGRAEALDRVKSFSRQNLLESLPHTNFFTQSPATRNLFLQLTQFEKYVPWCDGMREKLEFTLAQ